MRRWEPRRARIVAVVVAIALSLAGVALGPATRAAASEESSATLFRATFASAPLGPVSGQLPVEVGTVAAQGAGVSIVESAGGRALQVSGAPAQSAALLRWSNYPGALPGAPPPAVKVTVSATLRASSTDAGATFALLAGAAPFELFAFGAGGQLTRAGSPVGLTYAISEPVRLEARVLLPGGTSPGNVQIKLSSGGSQRTLVAPLTADVTSETLNQLRLQAPAGGGAASIGDVSVRFEQEGEGDDDPPAAITVGDGDVTQDQEVVNGVVFVNIRITIANGGAGGKAHSTTLVLDLDELGDLDLADVGFLQGVGFVREIRDGKVYIGIGENNVVYGDSKVVVKIKLRVHPGKSVRATVRLQLQFRDTSGPRVIVIAPVVIVVAVPGATGVPGGSTPPISGTLPISGTSPISGTEVVRLPVTRIDIRLRAAWQRRGSVLLLGLPISAAVVRTDGVVVQYFERARLELHPGQGGAAPTVMLGRLGAELGYTTVSTAPSATGAPTATAELRWYFPDTGHLIAPELRGFWASRGGLAQFGMPIGPAHEEGGLLVQYFERARLELHPEARGTAYAVQVGLLGVEAYLREGGR